MLIQNCINESLGNKICLIQGNVQLTYQEFTRQINDLAYRLATELKKGDKVLLKLSNPLDQLLYFFGILKAGGSCIFVDLATPEEICKNLMATHNINIYIDKNFPLPNSKVSSLPESNEQDLFLGALSSGSTGTPKLIWRNHESWVRAFPSQSIIFHLSNTDTLYLVSSLSYTANLNACLHILFEGGTVVFSGNSMPRTWLQEIIDNQVTAIFMVPANYKILLKNIKAPLTQVTSLVTCGAKMDLATVKALVEYFPIAEICEYYGASELGHVSYSKTEDLLERPTSVGKAFPHVTISIEDETIWIESPYIAPNYRPKATVGDLGKLDTKGYLYLLGRKHGMINTSGVKVIPEQVETVLLQCPGISEAVVGGIDDPIRGQKVCAWIVKSKAALTAADIFDFCKAKMRPHHCPQKIIFLDEIPLNQNGKIDRIRLKDSVFNKT